MYSTQAILPELSREFDVSAAAGRPDGVDRDPRRWPRARGCGDRCRTAGAASAPSCSRARSSRCRRWPRRSRRRFGVLLACRALQGLCMPGLLTVGAPYVVEVFGPRLGGRAMGLYITALVSGGIVGRVGIALATTLFGWRWPVGALSLLPATGAVVMARTLPEAPRQESTGAALGRGPPPRAEPRPAAGDGGRERAVLRVRRRLLVRDVPPGRAAVRWSQAAGGLIFLMWGLGALGPLAGSAGRPASAGGASCSPRSRAAPRPSRCRFRRRRSRSSPLSRSSPPRCSAA